DGEAALLAVVLEVGVLVVDPEGGEVLQPAGMAAGVLPLLLEQAGDGAGIRAAGLDAATAQEGVLGELFARPDAGSGRGGRGHRPHLLADSSSMSLRRVFQLVDTLRTHPGSRRA